MKTRNGFVSNSSTTSFCIYGISIDVEGATLKKLFLGSKNKNPETYQKGIAKQFENYKDYLDDQQKEMFYQLENISSNTPDKIFSDLMELDDFTEVICSICPLFRHYNYDAGTAYIGRSFTSIRDDETGKEFKESIQNEILLYGFTDKCGTILDSYSS